MVTTKSGPDPVVTTNLEQPTDGSGSVALKGGTIMMGTAEVAALTQEASDVPDVEERRPYTFEVIPRAQLKDVPEEDLKERLVFLQGLAEKIDEQILSTEFMVKRRQSQLLRERAEADEQAKKDAEEARELQRQLDAKKASVEQNVKASEEAQRRLDKLR